ncbi:M14 family metallopeptidase [Eudoraea chungangensis]|uniref:M14 family metallopeptidase n=1 Tax=Eudoraea chungangensis TaxID=1481905 RepID=UPI0023ED4DFB|nr:M14 metallopeptidase family protein [Eudoraea chungangensis]
MESIDQRISYYKDSDIFGRYITNSDLELFIERKGLSNEAILLGSSIENKSIYGFSFGTGSIKILIWSQMHGNESTTTKAVFDFISLLKSTDIKSKDYLKRINFLIIPILNPDGAERYTRFNATGIDLNRDAQNLSQPESKVLRKAYEEFKPHFCFNMHDQRTIFSAGETKYPATLSFLTPAFNKACDLNESRDRSMRLITCIEQGISDLIPHRIGRYDDAYNLNCVGDTFQSLGTPTLLFEAGHYPEDYQREKTRRLVYYALVLAMEALITNKIEKASTEAYFQIPENKKLYFDILIKSVSVLNPELSGDLGILYKEILVNNSIQFKPYIAEEGNLSEYYGHSEFDCLLLSDLENLKNNKELGKILF